ncbi:MAG: outer membrane lipoprotein carrier protein LolA [Spirochaetales bacterium]|nr:outer membrane lipoprotein carrier protein LolA [Spirochaetales bacterium]
MYRRLFVSALLLSIALSISAIALDDPKLFDSQLDRNDPAFISMQESFSELPLVASYTQKKHIAKIGRDLVSTGKMLMAPGKGMAFIIERPYESVMVVGKEQMKQQIGSGKVKQLDVSGNHIYTSMATSLESIFTGDYDSIERNFHISFISEGGRWVIGLKPRDKALSAFIESISIAGREELEELLMVEKSGDYVLYTFEDARQRELNENEEKTYSI